MPEGIRSRRELCPRRALRSTEETGLTIDQINRDITTMAILLATETAANTTKNDRPRTVARPFSKTIRGIRAIEASETIITAGMTTQGTETVQGTRRGRIGIGEMIPIIETALQR